MILVGDSTMAPDSGWGDTFCADATPDVTCLNLGRGGRSSKSYREDGSWARVQKELATPGAWAHTWVFVQFGHNDAALGNSKATDFATEFTPAMARYVDEVRAAGATPVLLTPLTRRQFRAGLLLDTLSPWAAAVRKLATTRDVPLLDLATDSVIAVQAMGPVAAMALAADAPPQDLVVAAESGTTGEAMRSGLIPPEDRRFDYTHLGAHGARVFASMVEEELKVAVPELAEHFHAPPPG